MHRIENEPIEGLIELSPGTRQSAALGDFGREAEVEQGKAWRQHTLIRLVKQDRNAMTRWR